MAIELRAAYDFMHDELKARRGPALSFSRASAAWELKTNGLLAYHPDDAPRFWGGHTLTNTILDSTDLSGAAWTVDGVTIETGYTDFDGTTYAAMMTEDTTTGIHGLEQTGKITTNSDIASTFAQFECWFKQGGDNPARYVYVGSGGTTSYDDGTDEMQVLDLQTGYMTEGSESYGWSPAAGTADFVQYMGDGWYRVAGTANANGASADLFACGIAPSGTKAAVVAGHVGTGKTVLVAFPTVTPLHDPSSYFVPYMGKHIASSATLPGSLTVRQAATNQTLYNSELAGYTGKGSTPTGMGWSFSYNCWSEGTTTGDAEVVDSVFEGSRNRNDARARGVWASPDTDLFCNAVHNSGTAQQYFLTFDYGVWPQGFGFETYTAVMHIDSVVTAPSGPIMTASGWTGSTGDFSASYSDVDENGWVKMTWTSAASASAPAWGSINFGLGADGVNDTGDFTWSMPQLFLGDLSNATLPANGAPSHGYNYACIDSLFIAGARAEAGRGVRIERTQTNLLAGSEHIAGGDWTYTGGGSVSTIGSNMGSKGLLSSHRMINGNGGGSVAQTISQAITFETSERYELEFDMLPLAATQRWVRPQVTGLGALTLSTYCDPRHWSLSGAPAFGTTVGFTEENSSRQYADVTNGVPSSAHFRVSFTSDAADTTGTVLLGAADADGDDLILQDDTDAVNYIMGTALVKGYINTPIVSPIGSTGTRAADILTTSDITGIPTSGGLIYAKFRTARGVGYDQKTILSLSDGTANERIELAIDTSSNLVLTVIDGGVSQAAVTGATTIADDTTYEVAIYYDTNDFQIYLDGVVEGTPDTSGTLPTFTQFNLGSDWNDVNQLDGFLQEVKVYANALGSIAEISNGTYSDPASGIASSPRGLTRELTRVTS